MTGNGVSGEIARSSGAFFFIWTIIALGVTALMSLILSVRGLWDLRRTTHLINALIIHVDFRRIDFSGYATRH